MSEAPAMEPFHEPEPGEFAGTMVPKRQPSPYERYMASEGIPIYEGKGIHDVRELPLEPWSRLGVRGSFIVLDNTIDLLGMHVIEIPGRAISEPVHHMFDQKFWVVEGDGSTELWYETDTTRHQFEWHTGSLLAIPMNTTYRLVNSSSKPALLLAGNNAPPIMDLFDDMDFVFNNRHEFRSRYNGEATYFDPVTDAVASLELGRATWCTNIISDVVNCHLPLDNQRSPGYRRVEFYMANGRFWGFIGEHEPGRYSKAHAHKSGAVLVCVKGSGYTLNWPREVGPTPWTDGAGDAVERVDYVAGGMVAAAPGGGDWYHQHFGVSKNPLRLLVFFGGLPTLNFMEYSGLMDRGKSGRAAGWLNLDIEQGGRSVSYRTEDPYIREEFTRMLAKEGVEFKMPENLYK